MDDLIPETSGYRTLTVIVHSKDSKTEHSIMYFNHFITRTIRVPEPFNYRKNATGNRKIRPFDFRTIPLNSFIPFNYRFRNWMAIQFLDWGSYSKRPLRQNGVQLSRKPDRKSSHVSKTHHSTLGHIFMIWIQNQSCFQMLTVFWYSDLMRTVHLLLLPTLNSL
jgi:hypothetical protein